MKEEPNLKRRAVTMFSAMAVMIVATGLGSVAAQEKPIPIVDGGSASAPASTASEPTPGWLERDTLTGDWDGVRPWLAEHGITLKPRVSLFSQGLTSGAGPGGFEFGGKADLLFNADLSKLGFWNGLSMTVHAEYNFGESVNQFGGTLIPVNTALQFPGINGGDRFDVSSFNFEQKFGDSVSLKLGKINLIDLYATKPFQGGAGIDSFWNLTFAAPPSGTVPAYLLAAMLSVRTKPANFSLWIYDPTSVVNKSVFDKPFYDGVTIRGSVELPVTIAGRTGHQGFVATYSTKNGTDWGSLDDVPLPPLPPGDVPTKNNRYYFGYTFNQYLYQSKENPKEGVGLFGQFGVSDGNPNPLHWSGFVGVGGTGLIPRRSRDNWGSGYYYDSFSEELKDSLATGPKLRNEQGWEAFYNFAVTPWLVLGADVQIIEPALADKNAVFAGFRTMVRF
jgi:porin